MRRFYTAREQLDRAEFWHIAAERVPEGYFDDYETNPEMSTLYRGINLNSADIGDWTNPENVLKALGDNLGHSWTPSYQYARHRARASGNDRDRDTPPGDLQVLLQSTWDGRTGWNRDYPGSLEGEHEINLNGGTPVRLDQIEIRPAGAKRWRKLLKEPIHHVAGRTAAPANLEWRHNLDGGPNEWELIADPPTGPTQVVQTENSRHQHYGMARRISPGNYEHDTDYGTFGIRQVPDHLRDADDPYRGGPSWYLHPPTWDGSPDEAPSDVYWTKRDALDAIRQMESDPDSYGLTRTAGAYSDQMYADAADEIRHIRNNPTLPGMNTLPRSPKITTDPYAGPPGFDAPTQPYLPGMEVVDTADDTLRDLARRPPEESAESYGDRLEKALYDEFMDWWPNSQANLTRTDDNGNPHQWVTTNWRSFPDQPITHWMNVEDFLNERHPDAATGSNFGYEEAGDVMGMLDQPEYMQPTPEDLKEMRYTSLGNVITQAMLNLHNKLQGRTFASDSDRDRYMRLMLKHLGPQKAARLARLAAAADYNGQTTHLTGEDMEGLQWDWGRGRWVPRPPGDDRLVPAREDRPFDSTRKWPGWDGLSFDPDTRRYTAASTFSCPPGQPGCVSAMGVPDPDNTKMGPAGKKPTAEDYAEPWDANQTPPDYTDYSVYSGVGGGTGGGGSWGGGSSGGGGGSVGAGGIMDVSRPLYEQLRSINPDATIGGYREDSFGEHSRGSLDFMTTNPSEAQRAIQMGFGAGAPWAIWQQQMYYPDGRVEPMEDRGNPTQNHMDHVHTGPLL